MIIQVVAVPPLILAGITLYVGLYHLAISSRHEHRHTHVSFALLCLSMGAYDFLSAALYNATSLEQGVPWQRLQLVAIGLISVFFQWFVYHYLLPLDPDLKKNRRFLRGSTVFFVAMAIMAMVERQGWFIELNSPQIKRIHLFSGVSYTYYEMSQGPMATVMMLAGMLVFIYCLTRIWLVHRHGAHHEIQSILFALVLFFVGAANDVAVSLGLITSLYALEYAYTGIVLVMTYSLTAEVVRAAVVKDALRESQYNLQTLFETVDDFLIIFDQEGKIRHVNPAVVSRLGYPHETLTGMVIGQLVRPSPDAGRETIEEFFFSPTSRHHALDLQPKNGSAIPVDMNAIRGRWSNADVIFSLSRDVSERVRTEAELKQAHGELKRHLTFLEALLIALPNPVFYKDREGRYLGCNEAFCRQLGVTPETIQGRTVFELWPSDLAQTYHQKDLDLMASGGSQVYESQVKNAAGERRDVIYSKGVFRNEDGSVAGLVGAYVDITDRKRTEEELERYRDHLEEMVRDRTRELEKAQKELVRNERLAALGQLTATVSHEIRNPLGSIRAAVFTLGDDVRFADDERVRRAIQLAERNIIRCDNIIGELLDYTRAPVLDLQPVEIDPWLKNFLAEIAFPAHITCQEFFDAAATVTIDREHFRRVFMNLLTNAFQALDMVPESERRLIVRSGVVNDWVELRVEDSGPGMPDDVKARIFEPLFSTKSFGVGLGLVIVKKIVEQHGGSVEIVSQEGHGTAAVIRLPRREGRRDP